MQKIVLIDTERLLWAVISQDGRAGVAYGTVNIPFDAHEFVIVADTPLADALFR